MKKTWRKRKGRYRGNLRVTLQRCFFTCAALTLIVTQLVQPAAAAPGHSAEKASVYSVEEVSAHSAEEASVYSIVEMAGEQEDAAPNQNENTSLYKVYELKDTKILYEYQPVLSDPLNMVEYRRAEESLSMRRLSRLRTMVQNRIATYDGDWSVYVKNLNTDQSIIINNRPMKSASIMKLFIMGAVYQAIDAGKMERTDDVMGLLKRMITVSDNEASNRLLYLLGDSSYEAGIVRVDEFIEAHGFSDMTVEYNGFNNSDTVLEDDKFNQVSAKDCGKLLEDIYRREWVNASVSNEITEMLQNQHTRYKIPAGLPEGVLCGNKSGEMDSTENDAAIIFAEECDYILVVLSSDWSSKEEAITRIVSMSEMVYEFLN